MRLFVAIQFSDDLKQALISCMHDLKKQGVTGTYTPVQNLHFTMAFIGETDKAESVMSVMKTVPFQPFRLSLSGSGSFGDLLWIGVKGNQKLKGYAHQLQDALLQNGISVDKKELVPHITIVRKAGCKSKYSIPSVKADMMVKKISLMKSVQKDGRMIYTEIFSI